MDSVARPEDTEVTGGEVSVTQTADAGSGAPTRPTCSAPPPLVAVNKGVTVRRDVGVTHSDPGAVKGAHGGRRGDRGWFALG